MRRERCARLSASTIREVAGRRAPTADHPPPNHATRPSAIGPAAGRSTRVRAPAESGEKHTWLERAHTPMLRRAGRLQCLVRPPVPPFQGVGGVTSTYVAVHCGGSDRSSTPVLQARSAAPGTTAARDAGSRRPPGLRTTTRAPPTSSQTPAS